MTPVRGLLLSAVQDDLETIEVDQGELPFANTIRHVSRQIASPQWLADQALLPGITMVDKGDSVLVQPGTGQRLFWLELSLIVYFSIEQGEEAQNQALSDSLYGDVMYAMTSPGAGAAASYKYVTHGGRCIFTHYMGMDAVTAEGSTLGALMMDFRLSYHSTWQSP